jgi:hypothetical protein
VDVVSDVISHVAAVSCIHDPTFDATVAVHNARKMGARSGAQAEGRRASGSAAAVPVMPNDNRPSPLPPFSEAPNAIGLMNEASAGGQKFSFHPL